MNNGITFLPRRDDFFHPIEKFFNKFFDDALSDISGLKSVTRQSFPRLDIVTDNGKWIVDVSVPGMTKDDITVEILTENDQQGMFGLDTGNYNVLVISGRMNQDHQYSNNANWHVKELRRTGWERRVRLPENVVGEPEATLKNGMLRLSWEIPEVKTPEKKNIQIKCLDK